MCPIARVYLILVLHTLTSGCTNSNLFPLLTNVRSSARTGIYQLSNKNLTEIEDNAFKSFPNVANLYMTDNRLKHISRGAFTGIQTFLLHLGSS